MTVWQTTRYRLELSRPFIIGIVNLTPDSFSDGGRHDAPAQALRHCEQLLRDGADILDLGGESTRPGAPALPLEQERARVLPVLREALRLGVPVSLDTYKPALMQEALDLGLDIVNDIWALRQHDGALSAEAVVAAHPSCGVCLMHMHGVPQSMQVQPMAASPKADQPGQPAPVLAEVLSFLEQRTQQIRHLGVDLARIVWDMGIGFGKTVEQNFCLLAQQRWLAGHGPALLAGWSRKSALGAVTGLSVEQRLVPSVAAALLAVQQGAAIVRVHDVRETRAALQVWQAMQAQSA